MDLIDSLIDYVNEIKPYHTKIYGVDVEYRSTSSINVSFDETIKFNIWLGIPQQNLTQFNWSIEELNYPQLVDTSTFLYNNNSGNSWDSEYWSEIELLDDTYLIKKGSLYDNVVVEMIDNVVFYFDHVPLYTYPILIGNGNPKIDGIVVADYTNVSIKLLGNYLYIFDTINSFTIEDSIGNDGAYGILYSTYDANTDITEIFVTPMNYPQSLVVSGRVMVYEWMPTYTPLYDVQTDTHFNESLVITEGFGWDDPNAGGWDNEVGGWDNVINQYIYSTTPIQTLPPIPTTPDDFTSDEFWINSTYNNTPFIWDNINKQWDASGINTGWDWTLNVSSNSWNRGLRSDSVVIELKSGSDLGTLGFTAGTIGLYDILGRVVGSGNFNFSQINTSQTLIIPLDNIHNHDYTKIIVETMLQSSCPSITYINF